MIFYSEEDKQFYTIPDGDVATAEQIKQYYEDKYHKVMVEIPINIKGANNEKV